MGGLGKVVRGTLPSGAVAAQHLWWRWVEDTWWEWASDSFGTLAR